MCILIDAPHIIRLANVYAGMTPLLTACSMDGNLACVQMLAKSGANMSAKDNNGMGWDGWAKGQAEKVWLYYCMFSGAPSPLQRCQNLGLIAKTKNPML
jgi:hypothetical protein